MDENSRSRYRKQKKMNRVLNISIGVVILLIAYIGGKLFFSNSGSEEATANQPEEVVEEELVEEDLGHGIPSEETVEEKIEESESATEETLRDESNDADLPTLEPNPGGPWEPIGTIQDEPFAAVYDREHQNWKEMTAALQYATGLGDNMIIWHLGNGGDHKSAVGVVSVNETKQTPYRVRLEWIDYRGWKPVSVERLEENPRAN